MDPASGQDQANSGTADAPFRTVGYALQQAAAIVVSPEHPDSSNVSVALADGSYSDDPVEGSSETFPILVPAALRSLEIAPRTPGGSCLFVNTSPTKPGFYFERHAEGETVTLSIRDITLRGGRTGMRFPGEASGRFELTLSGCRFEQQEGRAVEVLFGAPVQGAITVDHCVFEGGRGGILVESGFASNLKLGVSQCRFERLRKYSSGGVLGAGIDIFLDQRALIDAFINHNVCRGAGSFVTLTEAEELDAEQPSEGYLTAYVTNNLIHGSRDVDAPEAERVANAVYLSLWPHNSTNVLIANNTFADIDGHVVYQDNVAWLNETGLVAPFSFFNNICRRTGGASEFNWETVFPGDGAAGPFPPPGVQIENNLLEKSALGSGEIGGNLAADPLFMDEAALDFQLAQGSPAVDRGKDLPFTLPDRDLAGNCRRTIADCRLGLALEVLPIDLGALEQPGVCEFDTSSFVRGNCNGDERNAVDIADAIKTFSFLFMGDGKPPCIDPCDSNDDGNLNITDGIFTLSHLFTGGRAPPLPGGMPGPDPTYDCLESCEQR